MFLRNASFYYAVWEIWRTFPLRKSVILKLKNSEFFEQTLKGFLKNKFWPDRHFIEKTSYIRKNLRMKSAIFCMVQFSDLIKKTWMNYFSSIYERWRKLINNAPLMTEWLLLHLVYFSFKCGNMIGICTSLTTNWWIALLYPETLVCSSVTTEALLRSRVYSKDRTQRYTSKLESTAPPKANRTASKILKLLFPFQNVPQDSSGTKLVSLGVLGMLKNSSNLYSRKCKWITLFWKLWLHEKTKNQGADIGCGI